MKRHTVSGDDTFELAERQRGDGSALRIARGYALTHQQKRDGSGCPQGLAGGHVPRSGRRPAACAALVSRRSSKEPQTRGQAASILANRRGTRFDPDVRDAFLANQARFNARAPRFSGPQRQGSRPAGCTTPDGTVAKSCCARGVWARKVCWTIVGALTLGLAAIMPVEARAAADTFAGVGLFVGAQYFDIPFWYIKEDLDWQEVQARFLVGEHLTKRWDLWFEVTVGSITWDRDIPDSLEIGATAMTSYDFYEKNGRSLYGELGGGFGWLTNNPDADMVYPGALGLIDYGVGAKVKLKSGLTFKIGPRFHHRSAMMRPDSGMNSYGLIFSILK